MHGLLIVRYFRPAIKTLIFKPAPDLLVINPRRMTAYIFHEFPSCKSARSAPR